MEAKSCGLRAKIQGLRAQGQGQMAKGARVNAKGSRLKALRHSIIFHSREGKSWVVNSFLTRFLYYSLVGGEGMEAKRLG